MNQLELYERFRALHEQKGGFIMPNAWDGLSALSLKQAGFEGLGTSSAALATTLGRLDGRHAVRVLAKSLPPCKSRSNEAWQESASAQ
jgi:2-methylisocitrate lyase-like PEP mutase family enzyme